MTEILSGIATVITMAVLLLLIIYSLPMMYREFMEWRSKRKPRVHRDVSQATEENVIPYRNSG